MGTSSFRGLKVDAFSISRSIRSQESLAADLHSLLEERANAESNSADPQLQLRATRKLHLTKSRALITRFLLKAPPNEREHKARFTLREFFFIVPHDRNEICLIP